MCFKMKEEKVGNQREEMNEWMNEISCNAMKIIHGIINPEGGDLMVARRIFLFFLGLYILQCNGSVEIQTQPNS